MKCDPQGLFALILKSTKETRIFRRGEVRLVLAHCTFQWCRGVLLKEDVSIATLHPSPSPHTCVSLCPWASVQSSPWAHQGWSGESGFWFKANCFIKYCLLPAPTNWWSVSTLNATTAFIIGTFLTSRVMVVAAGRSPRGYRWRMGGENTKAKCWAGRPKCTFC